MTTTNDTAVAEICRAVRARGRFVITSHTRPDGDAIGSELAMAYALRALGKQVRVVNKDPAPEPMADVPGVRDIEIAGHVTGDFDAAIVMECSELARTGVEGLDRGFVINIDHHPGNLMFGAINWFDLTAAACGEMVFDLVEELGVPVSREIATHIYLAILTDTGSFHYSSISPRTFDICRRTLEAGVDPVAMARRLYDTNTVARLRLCGAVLNTLEIDQTGRFALVRVTPEMLSATGGTYDDTDGLVNLPLTVKGIEAVVFLKEAAPGVHRVSLRSKGDVDVGSVAKALGGGGHRNAAGCTLNGSLEEVRQVLTTRVREAIGPAGAVRPAP